MFNDNMLRLLCKTCSRSCAFNRGRPGMLTAGNPEFQHRTATPTVKFSQDQGKPGSSSEEKVEKVPTTQSDEHRNFVLRNKIRGDHVRITSTKKKFLALSGRWKNSNDIPDYLPGHQYNSDMWVVRIRVAAFIMVFWLLTCFCVASVGRKHVKERSHQVVMQQYLDGLSAEEREKCLKEYNLDEK